jgi:hypothetical protein
MCLEGSFRGGCWTGDNDGQNGCGVWDGAACLAMGEAGWVVPTAGQRPEHFPFLELELIICMTNSCTCSRVELQASFFRVELHYIWWWSSMDERS